jgi:hypothetical protein
MSIFTSCPGNLETDVCHYMMDTIEFSKLEARLSVMPFEDFSNCLAYTLEGRHTFVFLCCFSFLNPLRTNLCFASAAHRDLY